ncbi:hypothetical protein ACI780_18155 [Geodermatophilus sp. SYSU D00814]
MTTPALADVPVRSSQALTRRWVSLLTPSTSVRRSLWLTWLGADGRQSPVVLPVDDVPVEPDRGLLSRVLDVHAEVGTHLTGDGAHLALALCRPGEPVETDDDGEWVGALHEVLDGALDGTWSLHLAAGGRVEPLVDVPSSFLLRAGDSRR